ncbi:MAG: MFS transporter [Planktomarina sp.]
MFSAVLASSMGFIDGTVANIALPAIRSDLNAGLFQAQWVQNAYMLFLSALMLFGGSLGDRFGTVRIFRIGVVIFTIASVASAIAPNIQALITARSLQGVGAALMIPCSLALVAQSFKSEEQGQGIGTWVAASAAVTALGPLFAAIVLSLGDDWLWRAVFIINLPLGLIALWAMAHARPRPPEITNIPVDWQGAITVALSLGVFAWGMTQLITAYDQALFWIICGIALFVLFLAIQKRSKHPMLPLYIFKNRSFSIANIATFFLYASMSIVLLFLPMTVVSTWGLLEVEAVIAFAPISIFTTLLSKRIGRLSDRYGAERITVIGAILVGIGYVALAATTPLQQFWFATLPSMIIVGLGMAFVIAPISTVVMTAHGPQKSGLASGVNNVVSRIAGFLGVAVAGFVAAAVYDGPLTFAEASFDAAHVAQTNASFAALAYLCAAAAFLAALFTQLGIKRRL